jgi:hypothetical protein
VQPPALPQVTVAELAERAFATVEGETRVDEAHDLAGSINSLIGRLNGGLVAPGADVMAELTEHADTRLGERAKAWHGFMQEIADAIGGLREQGQITTAPTAIPALAEIAAVLARVKQ